MKNSLTIAAIFAGFNFCAAQEVNPTINKGNEFYRKQQYDRAETEYRKALEQQPANNEAKFNLANALAKQNKLDEADKLFVDLGKRENPANFRSKAYYNIGVMMTNQKKLEQSIEFYKEALRIDPTDKDARENLQKALLELKKKNPPPKKQEKKKDEQQKQKPRPKMSPKQAQQQLKLLEQKEKQVQQKLQQNSSKTGNALPKDW